MSKEIRGAHRSGSGPRVDELPTSADAIFGSHRDGGGTGVGGQLEFPVCGQLSGSYLAASGYCSSARTPAFTATQTPAMIGRGRTSLGRCVCGSSTEFTFATQQSGPPGPGPDQVDDRSYQQQRDSAERDGFGVPAQDGDGGYGRCQ